VHKIFLHFGALTLYWYGVMVAIGFLAGLWIASRRALKTGLAPEKVLDLGPWLIGGAIVGARALFVISYWNEFFRGQPWWKIFMIQEGGLVFYGGLIGASVTGVMQMRRMKLPFWPLSDILAPCVALGHMFGRLGCFMNGCCYGSPTQCAWAVHFPANHETAGVGVHPTQLYEAALNLALFLGLSWFFPRRRYAGQIFAWYMIGYAVIRWSVELFRGDYYDATPFFTPGQKLSYLLLAAGLAAIWWLPRRAATPPLPVTKNSKPS
jgi:phosphatidylglycerol---prolipoprotein diacylglyceryl transferase